MMLAAIAAAKSEHCVLATCTDEITGLRALLEDICIILNISL